MKMKNVLLILITLALVFTMVGGVAADGSTMYVNYSVTQQIYNLVIPPSITFGDGNLESDNQTVMVYNYLYPFGVSVEVNMTAGNVGLGATLYNLTNQSSYIPYFINYTDEDIPVENGDTILTADAGDIHSLPLPAHLDVGPYARIGQFVNLTFKTTEKFIHNATLSGLHSDLLTFEIRVVGL